MKTSIIAILLGLLTGPQNTIAQVRWQEDGKLEVSSNGHYIQSVAHWSPHGGGMKRSPDIAANAYRHHPLTGEESLIIYRK